MIVTKCIVHNVNIICIVGSSGANSCSLSYPSCIKGPPATMLSLTPPSPTASSHSSSPTPTLMTMPSLGGPVGLPPLFFFILAGKLKIRKLRKRGKKDGPRSDDHCHFRHPIFQCTLPLAGLGNNPHCCAILLPIMVTRLHGAHCAACGLIPVIGDIVSPPVILQYQNSSGQVIRVIRLIKRVITERLPRE
jgi:hypothetical protein